MSGLRYSASISLDGFVAGPDQSLDNPLGVGGLLLHTWMRELAAWREAVGLEGGVTNASTAVLDRDDDEAGFEFVTGGIEAALTLARAAADGKDVTVSGGGTVARQYLAAGLLDEIELHLVPVLLGAGVRLFDEKELAGTPMEQIDVVEAPGVTHIRYRVRR